MVVWPVDSRVLSRPRPFSDWKYATRRSAARAAACRTPHLRRTTTLVSSRAPAKPRFRTPPRNLGPCAWEAHGRLEGRIRPAVLALCTVVCTCLCPRPRRGAGSPRSPRGRLPCAGAVQGHPTRTKVRGSRRRECDSRCLSRPRRSSSRADSVARVARPRPVLAVHHLDSLTSGSPVHVLLACVHGSATKPAESRQSKLPGQLAATSPDRSRTE